MDRQRFTRIATRIAKSMLAGITRSDIFDLYSKSGGEATSEILWQMTGFAKMLSKGNSATSGKFAELGRVLQTAAKKATAIEARYDPQIQQELE